MKHRRTVTVDSLVKSIERKSRQAAERGIQLALEDQIRIGLATGAAARAVELSHEAMSEGRLEDGVALYDGAMSSLVDAEAKLDQLLKTGKR